MIYLINIPSYTNFKYWVVDDTTGACLSASTPQDAIIEFVRESFKFNSDCSNYAIADQRIFGDILAKASTIQQLIDNYPEYFI